MKIQLSKQCKNCQQQIEKFSSRQLYCSICAPIIADEKSKLRMKKYVKKSYILNKDKRNQELKEKGKTKNEEFEPLSIGYSSSFEEKLNPDFGQMFRFWIPYDINLSKNRSWRTTRTGHVYTAQKAKSLMESITEIVKSSKIEWNINKIYLEIIVQKLNMRGDAINFLDTIADAIKRGILLDDNWFAVKKLDWEIVKENPRIYITILQEKANKYPCRFCGIFQAFDQYGKDRNSKYGITGECKDCLRKE